MRAVSDIVESVVGPVVNGARALMLLWFGGIMLFGILTTVLVSGGFLFGNTPEVIEAAERRQEARAAAEREEFELKSRDARQRALSEHGWGSDAAASSSTGAQTPSNSRSGNRRNLREAKEAREAGWGS